MANEYDVIVAGLGAMGSAAAYQLSIRGRRVLGLDRFHPPHNWGSSHGLTRIIREAYFEHPLYVPLVQRAYALWKDVEQKSGRRLLMQTGGLMIGRPEGVLVEGSKRSAEEHRLAHQVLSSKELKRRFPMLAASEDMVAVWEPRAGILFPELAIRTHLELAGANGAELRYEEPILKWQPTNRGITVQTAVNSYHAKRLLLSAGAWVGSLVPELNLPVRIERQILFWFEPRANAVRFGPEHCPIHL